MVLELKEGLVMELSVKDFLEERNILKDALLKIISKTEVVTDENLEDFCVTLTDYLTGSVVKLGLTDDFSFATAFSNTYSKGVEDQTELKKDLSELIIWLSKRWDKEDIALTHKQSEKQ